MKNRRAAFAFIVFLLAAVSAGQARTNATLGAPPARSIVGTWVVVSAERQLDPYPELQGATVTFTDKTFRIERLGGRSAWFGNLTVDQAKGTIDLLHQAKLLIPPIYGAKWEGIFRFDGDMLEMCYAEGHDARPSEFLSGYDLTLIKLRRK